MTIPGSRVLRFDPFELDLRSRELFKQGRKIHLQDQPFQVLAALLEAPGEVVTRDELRRRIWSGDTFVDFDVGLNAAVKRLRQALNDSADDPRFVETLPRVGYRFLAPVRNQTASEKTATVQAPPTEHPPNLGAASKPAFPASGAKRHWVKIAVAVFAIVAVGGYRYSLRPPVVTTPVIAVLPFKNLSAQPGEDYFSDGLADEIVRNLSTIDGLQVRSRTSSSFSFESKDKPPNIREVGARLNANLVLAGSVLREGERLRIQARLVRVEDDSLVWSGRYDRERKDVFAIQDEISNSIVTQLRLKLGTGRRHYQTTPDVYDAYLRGIALTKSMPPDLAELQQALSLFEGVVAKDPEFAPGHAGMARVLAKTSLSRRANFVDASEKARVAVQNALRLDPLLPEAHGIMGSLQAQDLDWERAQWSYRRALALDPNLSEARTDFALTVLLPLGKMDEAISQTRKAVELDPGSSEASHTLLIALYVAGRFDETIQMCERILVSDPNDIYTRHVYGRVLAQTGKLPEAIAIFEKERERARPAARRFLGYAYARIGRRADAERLALEQDPAQFRQSVLIYAGLGDAERTIGALTKMAAEHDSAASLFTVFPELGFLRGDPRFKEFRRQRNLPNVL